MCISYRKEQKKYGTGKLIEGEYTEGKTKCLILEDVVTTGSSIVETTQALRNHGILVDHAIVVLNRNFPAADENLKKNGISLTSIVKVNELLHVLLDASRITEAQKIEVESFLATGQSIPVPPLSHNAGNSVNGKNGLDKNSETFNLTGYARELMDKIVEKQSNLCLSADCENWQEVLEVADAVGSKICAVKTHVDAISFNDSNEIEKFKKDLMSLAAKHKFLIIEDRKFADIGSTVEKQLTAKPFSIADWANFVTVHSIPGPGMLKVFKEHQVGVILIAEMSSAGNIPSVLPAYKEKTLEICTGYEDTVVGFVSQSRVGLSLKTAGTSNDGSQSYLQFTPGISLNATGDALGQQYVSVKEAVLERDADIIIVGRGIIKQERDKWSVVAEDYRKQGWEAFQKKLNIN